MECKLKTDAKLSSCRNYRFALWRTWDDSKPFAMIIGLNPSTADEVENDPTIIRCINFAKSWGYGVFAWQIYLPIVQLNQAI